MVFIPKCSLFHLSGEVFAMGFHKRHGAESSDDVHTIRWHLDPHISLWQLSWATMWDRTPKVFDTFFSTQIWRGRLYLVPTVIFMQLTPR